MYKCNTTLNILRGLVVLPEQESLCSHCEFLVGLKKKRTHTEKIGAVTLRQSSLTCFCSRALQWAASAACWHPDSRAGLWGPSAVEPVGETKQETSHELALPLDDVIHYLISYLDGVGWGGVGVISYPSRLNQSINRHTILDRSDHHLSSE